MFKLIRFLKSYIKETVIGSGAKFFEAVLELLLPIFMGIFTAWFQKWYPAKVARGQ